MHKSLVALCLLFSISSFANLNADKAATAYAGRDYNAVGVQNVQDAVMLYDAAIAEETNEDLKLTYLGSKASAHYFLGTALDKKSDKMAAHQAAMDIADDIMQTLGVDNQKASELSQDEINQILDRLTDTQELILAEAMYSKGISLAQWGNLKGISSSIKRLPEVLGLMKSIEDMGYAHIHEYGPFRTIGRINFKLPKLFGGDLDKSEDYLLKATKATLAEGQRYSVNGYNNLYLAETFYKNGKEKPAQKILDTFINADFSTLKVGNEPENREALRAAKILAEKWN